ncbi:MAG: polymer-forming cytoskeletal protein [bacterium]|nr:polymer-forming cytoskeletal protein [bacterium]
MFGFKKRAQKGKITTILGENSHFTGKLTLDGEGMVRIDGRFEGEIKANGDLIIGKSGDVKANVVGGYVIIGGKVEGNVTTHKHLELQSGGQLIGDIRTPSLGVGEGVTFKGNCNVEHGLLISHEGKAGEREETKKIRFPKIG